MRPSAHNEDPGYKAYRALSQRGIAAMITVNGLPVRHCITADTKRGIAVVSDLDDFGRVQLTSKRDSVKRKVFVGRVAIEFVRKGF